MSMKRFYLFTDEIVEEFSNGEEDTYVIRGRIIDEETEEEIDALFTWNGNMTGGSV